MSAAVVPLGSDAGEHPAVHVARWFHLAGVALVCGLLLCCCARKRRPQLLQMLDTDHGADYVSRRWWASVPNSSCT